MGNALGGAAAGAGIGASVGSIVPGLGTAIGGAIGAIGGLFAGIFGGGAEQDIAYKKAALTDQQADWTEKQTNEQLRRFNLQAGQVEGEAYARVGASGFALGGSMSKYADALTKEFGVEAAWMKRAGYQTAAFQRQAADIQRQGGDAQLLEGTLSGLSSFASGAAAVFRGYGDVSSVMEARKAAGGG